MKKLLFSTLILLCWSVSASADKKVYVKSTLLPREAQIWIDRNMADQYISYIEASRVMGKIKSYEVHFVNKKEVEFDAYGQITEIDFQQDTLPESVVPQAIKQYVKDNYPNTYICEYKQGKKEQEIKLNTDLELIFDRQGLFLRIDD